MSDRQQIKSNTLAVADQQISKQLAEVDQSKQLRPIKQVNSILNPGS